MFNFWWSDGLVDGLEPYLPPLSSQKNKMLIFGLRSTSDDRPGWLMDSKPHVPPFSSQKNKMLIFGLRSTSDNQAGLVNGLRSCPPPLSSQKIKCSFLDYVQLLMIGWAGRWTQKPSATLSSQKNKMFIFGLHSTSDDRMGWLMDSNPICHPSPVRKIKCSFLDYVQLLMISQAVQWTWNLSATPLQPQKWNAGFSLRFNFWRLAGLVDGLETRLPPLSSQKNKMLIFGLHSTSDDRLGWSMDSIHVHHPSPVKKLNAHFWITFNFWWSAGLVDGLEPHLPLLSSQKNKMLIFGLHSTYDDWLGWSMYSNPEHHPSPVKKIKYSFLDYIQLLMIGQAGRWTRTPSAIPL